MKPITDEVREELFAELVAKERTILLQFAQLERGMMKCDEGDDY